METEFFHNTMPPVLKLDDSRVPLSTGSNKYWGEATWEQGYIYGSNSLTFSAIALKIGLCYKFAKPKKKKKKRGSSKTN